MAENQWGSNLSFILAMIGSAVGLGNIWRFSYVLYDNGGGAFYIPYLVAILVMAIPFLILEYGVGYNFKSSFAKAIKTIDPKWEFLGWFLPLAVFIIMVYYSVLIGWDGIYFVLSFTKGWGSNPNNFFLNTLLQNSDSPLGLFNFIPVIAIAILIGWLIFWFISHKDLESGIGRISKFLVPLLFIIMIFIVIVSLSLPGASIGLAELYHPDWYRLSDFGIWMEAFGQVIFSLSIGMSVAFTYASYTKDGTDLISNTFLITIANSLFENFAALGVFSILGYMSLQSGVPVESIVSEGTGLVFIVYPMVFNVLGQWAYVLGPLFFLTVYLAGFTSILSTMEPLSFSIQNKFAFSRSKTVTILCILGGLLSMFYATSFATNLLKYVDMFINQIALLIAVVVECILFSWIYKAEKVADSLNPNSKYIKLNKSWIIMVKYIVPICISIIWIGGVLDTIHDGGSTEFLFMSIVALSLIISTIVLTKLPAKNPEWDLDVERK